MTVEQSMAEAGTGCCERIEGGGPLYIDPGEEVNDEAALDKLLDGVAIHAPNAGAGSFRPILERLKFTQIELVESGSSAGDWTIAAFDGQVWRLISQDNRHPYFGFSYAIGSPIATEAYEDLLALLS